MEKPVESANDGSWKDEPRYFCKSKSRRVLSVATELASKRHDLHKRSKAGKDKSRMSQLQSNTDAMLVAIPMVGVLFAGFFKLDELFGRPKKPVENRRQMSGLDENGLPVCADPDGTMPRRRPKK